MSDSPATTRLINRLRLRQVALLLEVRAAGTLRGAALRLGMSQPAASKMLGELETALGCPLFERVGRGLRLTEAGELVVEHCESLRGSIAALARTVAGLQTGSGGRLAIGSITATAIAPLSQAVAQLKREQPRLLVSIDTDTSDRLLERLDQGVLDVMIGRLVEGRSRQDYRFEPLAREELSVVVGAQHPLATARRVRLTDLASAPWVLQPHVTPMRELIEREFRLLGIDSPEDVIETSSILTLAGLLEQSERAAVVPTEVAKYYAQHGLLAILPVRLSQTLERFGWIVRRGRPLSSGARRFVQLLQS